MADSIVFLLFILAIISRIQTQPLIIKTYSSFSISDPQWFPFQSKLTLISPNSIFSAGFLPSPSNSSLFFFTVWIESSSSKTPVWNLGPVPYSSPIFISDSGSLTLTGLYGLNLFPSYASGSVTSSFLRLNNDGSLNFSNWTSFSFPTNTLLPNQLLGNASGQSLSSGFYRFNGASLLFNSTSFWTTDLISYLTIDGTLVMKSSNPRKALVSADHGNNHTLRRLTLDADGNLRLYSLRISSGEWMVVWEAISELCIIPNTCGPNSICFPGESFGETNCVCAPGFRDSSVGCVRKKEYLPNNSKFIRLDYIKFTTKGSKVSNSLMNFNRCRLRCLADPNCVGFRYLDQCYNHFSELTNGYWSPFSQTTTYLRVAISENDFSNFTSLSSMIDTTCPVITSLPFPALEAENTIRNALIIAAAFLFELLICALCFTAFLRRYVEYRDMAQTFGAKLLPTGRPNRFSYAELRAATSDFSNILGSGGFGVVYRGNLSDGSAVAVKHLTKRSNGDVDFWTEVATISRMHHLNIVQIWGFCAEKDQRMLVYEYIPNGSLDKFLFNDGTRPDLDLDIRYRIAVGVARAIAYLHEECMEWVLHCDIKPENILLDENFCPKVSDFGLSKLKSRKERVRMSKIRGTRGYMAPEWVMNEEPITAKADVYSFGVVLLELVAGVRCWEFRRESVESVDWYFPRWAYEKVFVEGKVEDLVDDNMVVMGGDCEQRTQAEIMARMLKTAMWCVQEKGTSRPSMGEVVKMLEGTVEISVPRKPTIFYLDKDDRSD